MERKIGEEFVLYEKSFVVVENDGNCIRCCKCDLFDACLARDLSEEAGICSRFRRIDNADVYFKCDDDGKKDR